MISDASIVVCRTPDERLQDLWAEASKIPPLPGLNIQEYFRLMRNMVSTAEQYERSNEKAVAFKLSSRFLILFLEHLPKHQGYASMPPTQKNEWKIRCATVLAKTEKLKIQLRKQYELDYEEYLESEKEMKRKIIETEEKAEAEKQARLEQEKRQRVMGTLVPKSMETTLIDTVGPRGIPNYTLPEYPTPTSVLPPGGIPSTTPAFDRSLKPTTTNAHGWSTVRISPYLADRFLQLAMRNTTNNTETCGNLCGRLVGKEFHVTDLFLPKQSGTSDSCATYQEEELFEYTDKHELMVLGWIHTHPSQTAFLSSVDQHCQLSYQIMLPEAIAIVCAPKFNEIKTFSLTASYGVDYIRQCNKTGFHPHNESQPIYEPSSHILDDPGMHFNVIDMR